MMTAPTIKPIETRYKGYRFRSRLEARWAVFFDRMGIPYVYERQGYVLPKSGTPYLPDFELTKHAFAPGYEEGTPMAVEVKGIQPWIDRSELRRFDLKRMQELSELMPVLMLGDIPEQRSAPYPPALFTMLHRHHGDAFLGMSYAVFFHRGDHGTVVPFTAGHFGSMVGERRPTQAIVEECFEAARSARFEHGEQP